MPEIVGSIEDFVRQKGARVISAVPTSVPNQRGPSCGFYALSFVMSYWQLRSKAFGGDYKAEAAPLPARTNLDGPKVKDAKQQAQRSKDAVERQQFTSLRHYGKLKGLTLFGSVFNADDLLSVARGAGSQYDGRYDGKVVNLAHAADFADKVRSAIALEVPVIVPYDADGKAAEPGNCKGANAHWVVIFGIYEESSIEYAVYFTWGKFCYAPLLDFGTSNAQLTSNSPVKLSKLEQVSKGKPVLRDYKRSEYAPRYEAVSKSQGYAYRVIKEVSNPEFNDPTESGKRPAGKLDDLDGRNRLQVGGLRGRMVVVHRAEDREFLQGQMNFLA